VKSFLNVWDIYPENSNRFSVSSSPRRATIATPHLAARTRPFCIPNGFPPHLRLKRCCVAPSLHAAEEKGGRGAHCALFAAPPPPRISPRLAPALLAPLFTSSSDCTSSACRRRSLHSQAPPPSSHSGIHFVASSSSRTRQVHMPLGSGARALPGRLAPANAGGEGRCLGAGRRAEAGGDSSAPLSYFPAQFRAHYMRARDC
jgi:hypothetical protein